MTTRRRRSAACAALAEVVLLAGCGASEQSTLQPESHASGRIEHLWWIMFVGAAIVFGVVTLLLIVAVLRSRARGRPLAGEPRYALRIVVCGGFLVPLAVLVGLFVLILDTLPATSAPRGRTSLTVRVTGRQWFWDVDYPAARVRTANEIHIPVGESVALQVRTRDVIHSFWVPRLNRKIDTIPGRVNSILLRADRPGVFRGQCAEFCGLQHAHMAFLVVAETPARFRAWLARESRPPPRPATAERRRGLAVFFAAGCSGCHTIAGTGARGEVGPDLTHLADRRTLAAVTIPNTRAQLAGWILDPQHVKPGNKMPGLDLGGGQLQALLDYLGTLR